jgi:hypothetical protein
MFEGSKDMLDGPPANRHCIVSFIEPALDGL